jgi:hypothetical protein
LIAWTRALPPRQRILVDPLRYDFLCIYAPQYLALSPVRSVLRDCADHQAILAGKHAVFSPVASTKHSLDDSALRDWLAARRVDYVLINADRYDSTLADYFRSCSEYQVVFDLPERRELVVGCAPCARSLDTAERGNVRAH